MKNAKHFKGPSNKDVAAKYGVPKNTLSTWVKNKEKLVNAPEKGTNVKRQKLKTGNHELVDSAIFKWFLNMRSDNVPLSASVIQEKAVMFAKDLNVENYQASDGWLRRWKERNNITFKTVSGESNSATPDMVNSWSETSLPTLLSNYELKTIYNADEFGLFFQCLPNKTYQVKSEKCSGGKLSEIRFTDMAAANAVGEKLPLFVIGKAKKPRCFKNVKFLPCRNRSQRKSWMDGVLFEEWVRELDRKFACEENNVALVIDNCPAHPHIENLKAIKLIFQPPTTSQTQPTDQGVIRPLKAKYRKKVVRKVIGSLEKNKTLPKISILQGMQMLVSAWDALTPETIVNCLRKAGISSESQEAAIAEDDDPFKELQDEIDDLLSIEPDHFAENIDAASLTDVDAGVAAIQRSPTDAEIVAELLVNEEEDGSDDESVVEEEDEPLQCPNENELLQVIETLQRFSLFSDKGSTIQTYVNNLERTVDQHFVKKKTQTVITDFF